MIEAGRKTGAGWEQTDGFFNGLGQWKRENLLRFVKLNSVHTMRTWVVNAAGRQALRRGNVATRLFLTTAVLGGVVSAQIAVPKYQGPMTEAPAPRPALPVQVPITPNATVVEYPIARVNDQIIDNSDYERAQRDLMEEARQKNMSAADLAEEQKNLLRTA